MDTTTPEPAEALRVVHVLVPLPRPGWAWHEDAEWASAKALCNGDTDASGCYTAVSVAAFGDRACATCLDLAYGAGWWPSC